METVLLVFSLALLTAGQLLQKLAAERAEKADGTVAFLGKVLLRNETWWAVLCLALGALAWLGVLYRMEVSKAFPFLSLGFVMVVLVARLCLQEVVPPARWLGVVLIVGGVVLIAGT